MLHQFCIIELNWILYLPNRSFADIEKDPSLMFFYFCCFFKMGHPRPLFVYFRSFQTIYRIKTVDFSGIRTRIIGIEGEHADHLTSTIALISAVWKGTFRSIVLGTCKSVENDTTLTLSNWRLQKCWSWNWRLDRRGRQKFAQVPQTQSI